MASYYLLDKSARKLLSVSNPNMQIGMHSAFNDSTYQRFFFETAGSGSAQFVYIIDDNGKKSYLTISDSNDLNAQSISKRYSLSLEKKRTDISTAAALKKQQMQWWVLSRDFSFSGDFFHLFPTIILRSHLQLDIKNAQKQIENHHAAVYFDGYNVDLRNLDGLSTDEKKLHCAFMLDNRQFLIHSQKPNSNLVLSASPQSGSFIPGTQPNVNNSNPAYWRIEAVNHAFHFWGGVYYICMPDPVLQTGGESVDYWLYNKGTQISILPAKKVQGMGEERNAQWEFIEIYDTGECLIKNLGSGNFLAVNTANNNLSMQSVYDTGTANENTLPNLCMRWLTESSNSSPNNPNT